MRYRPRAKLFPALYNALRCLLPYSLSHTYSDAPAGTRKGYRRGITMLTFLEILLPRSPSV